MKEASAPPTSPKAILRTMIIPYSFLSIIAFSPQPIHTGSPPRTNTGSTLFGQPLPAQSSRDLDKRRSIIPH